MSHFIGWEILMLLAAIIFNGIQGWKGILVAFLVFNAIAGCILLIQN